MVQGERGIAILGAPQSPEWSARPRKGIGRMIGVGWVGRVCRSGLFVAVLAGARESAAAPAEQPSAVPVAGAAAVSPAAAPSGAPEGAPPEALTLVLPAPTVVDKFNECLALSGEARATCLAGAVKVLREGLWYQACLWGVEPSLAGERHQVHPSFRRVSCGIEPKSAGRMDRDRALVLGRALDAADQLAGAAPEAVPGILLDLRRAASSLAQSGRGGFSIISQGGVSLGSWQGGYTYFLTEALKQRREALIAGGRLPENAPAIVTSTGASAGAVNALVSGLEGCSRRQMNDAEKTLFYRVWVDTLSFYRKEGKGGLLAATDDSKLGLFSGTPILDAMAAAEQYAGELTRVEAGCTFSLGLVTTHLESVRAPVHVDWSGKPLVTAPRLTERFALQVSPKASALPQIQNLTPRRRPSLASDPRVSDSLFYAKLGPTDAVTPGLLFEAVRASGAYPVAFEPVPLTYQFYNPESAAYETRRDVPFVDGGTLDNAPIRLAATINSWRTPPLPNPWLSNLFADPFTYVFVNPGVTSWETHPEPPGADETELEPTIWSTYSRFLFDLFATGLEAELSNSAEQLEFLRQQRDYVPRLSIPRRNMPITGQHLLHFMAFLNHDFRDFDFHVGMADASEQLHGEAELKDFGQVVGARLEGKKFACMREYYDNAVSARDQSLASREIHVDELSKPPFDDSCGSIEAGAENFRALLATMHNMKRWSRTSDYRSGDEIERFLSSLKTAGFKYEGGDPDTDSALDENPTVAFRMLAQNLIERLAGKHEGTVADVIQIGGTAAADAWVKRWFPRWMLHAGIPLNGLEAGMSFSPNMFHWERFNLRLDLLRLRSYRWRDELIRQRTGVEGVRERRLTGRTGLYAGVSAIYGLSDTPGITDVELGAGLTYEHDVAPWATETPWIRHNWGPTGVARLVLIQRLYLAFDYTRLLWGPDVSAAYEGHPPDTQWPSYTFQFSGGLRWF